MIENDVIIFERHNYRIDAITHKTVAITLANDLFMPKNDTITTEIDGYMALTDSKTPESDIS